jgi:hypothetical protein
MYDTVCYSTVEMQRKVIVRMRKMIGSGALSKMFVEKEPHDLWGLGLQRRGVALCIRASGPTPPQGNHKGPRLPTPPPLPLL